MTSAPDRSTRSPTQATQPTSSQPGAGGATTAPSASPGRDAVKASLVGKPLGEQEQMLAPNAAMGQPGAAPATPAPSEKRRRGPAATPAAPDPEQVMRTRAEELAAAESLPATLIYDAMASGMSDTDAVQHVRDLIAQAPRLAAETGHAGDPDVTAMIRTELTEGIAPEAIPAMLAAELRATPNPRDTLPFTPTGWDAASILRNLGQYDRAAGTQEDPFRCVQAVALASHVLHGPDDTVGYLADVMSQPNQVADPADPNRATRAAADLQAAIAAIRGRTATYADMSLAQDAAHRIRYAPLAASTPADCMQQIDPNGPRGARRSQALHVWCNSTAELVAQARTLGPGDQLIVDEVAMRLNSVFHDYEDEHPGQHPRNVNIDGRGVSRVRENRRPAPAQLDEQRDQHQGHQILIFRDSGGRLVYYDPERNNAAMNDVHTADIESDTRPMDTIFARDRAGQYNYYLVLGRITTTPSPAAAASTTARPGT